MRAEKYEAATCSSRRGGANAPDRRLRARAGPWSRTTDAGVMHAFIPALNVLTPRLLFKALAAWEVTVSLMVLATTLLRGPLNAPGRSEIQVEDRLRLTADGRGKPPRNRIDDEVGKRDTLAAVSIGQPAGVINGSGERRYDNLATADWEEQRRLRGCRGDGGDSDAGVLEGRRWRRIYYDMGALTNDRRLGGRVPGRSRRARARTAGCRGAARGAATRGADATRTAAAGRCGEPGRYEHRDNRLPANNRRRKPISLLLRLIGRQRVEVACDVAFVQRSADDGGWTPDRACGVVGEQYCSRRR